ncbi:uncharacterized protein UMAG_12085 [Mycosarcoma maydis]|uniref:Hikeshi-like domain-containing protein n=1 Tax=Mycosarcoma maydis TaxID=5270 RepID=A0A0D1CF42_MYCMD|nr:uncharacterized protein UMAG_12085 [Ustilago maydis 521]KIS71632.1 hypothetical protein UMAG_12085 [Ustilago maydis 521]|eukprot:XP_011386827.1 hypothetical protein UMAG_12085 [Ustilago maydis 521]
MFSVVLPGRLPLTNAQQVDETHCVFALDNVSTISHVVVFMTGVQAFPAGYSATVHLLWPCAAPTSETNPTSTAGAWKLLGAVRNTKPSAIFKVTRPASLATTDATATLGISIEPDALVDEQLATLHPTRATTFALTQPTSTCSALEATALSIAPKIAHNAFAYLSSFAPDSAPQTVPLLQKWLEQLERKLRAQGLGFLDKQE